MARYHWRMQLSSAFLEIFIQKFHSLTKSWPFIFKEFKSLIEPVKRIAQFLNKIAIVGLLSKSLSKRKCLDYRLFFLLSLTVAPLGVDCVLLLASSSGCRRAKALQMIGTIKVPKEDTFLFFFSLFPSATSRRSASVIRFGRGHLNWKIDATLASVSAPLSFHRPLNWPRLFQQQNQQFFVKKPLIWPIKFWSASVAKYG